MKKVIQNVDAGVGDTAHGVGRRRSALSAPSLGVAAFLALSYTLGCQGIEAPAGQWAANRSGGLVVVFDLFARPLPDVPLPNDIATRPDSSSPTGRRLNASMVAATDIETNTRRRLDQLDGWGTYGAITFSMEPAELRLDMGNVQRRHNDDAFDFSDDAIYLINIDPSSPDYGLPVPLDLGEGNFPPNLEEPNQYHPNDSRGMTSNILFETEAEDTNGNGRLDICEDRNHNGITEAGEDIDGDGVAFSAERDENGNGQLDPEEDLNDNGRLDCSEDTDYDGVLDVPNLYCGDDSSGYPIAPELCPDVPVESQGCSLVLPAEDSWLLHWYELESNTVVLRPLIPLRERSTYAVVLTERLVDVEGRPVDSPFPWNHHIDQLVPLRPLDSILTEHSELYGGITMESVRFAWTFTTQTVTEEIMNIREGLYGRGPLAELAEEFPDDLILDVTHACGESDDCSLPDNVYLVFPHGTEDATGLLDVLPDFANVAFGVGGQAYIELENTYEYVDSLISVRFESPNYLDSTGESEDVDGDGRLDLNDEDVNGNGELDEGEDLDVDGHLDVNEDLNENFILDGESGRFELDTARGYHPHGRHMVSGLITLPRADPERGIAPPYPVLLYGHGYTSNRFESVAFAGSLAKYGVAVVAIDSAHHGLRMTEVMRAAIESNLLPEDLAGLARSITVDRALDLNGDGTPDPGGDFLTAYGFHTRDMLRQTGIDFLRLVQLLRSFDGERLGTTDVDGDGQLDLAGDFDGDGQIDLGGPDADYFAYGSSLGAMISTFLAAFEPSIVAATPISAGGGLTDLSPRSMREPVQAAIVLRMMGPLIVTDGAHRHHLLRACSTGDDCATGEGCIEGVCRCGDVSDCNGNGIAGYTCHPAPQHLADASDVCARDSETSCRLDQTSVRFVVPDVSEVSEVEIACLEPEDLRPGDTIVVENLVNGERGCFVTWEERRSHIALPTDFGDGVRISIYEGDVILDGADCRLRDDASPDLILDEFGLDVEFQTESWALGEPLVSPADGYGMRRASPGMRRFLGIAQAVIDPADPVMMARYFFHSPLDYGDGPRAANVLAVATVGDMDVPINAGLSIARSAGILDIFRRDPRLADLRHPEGQTHNRYLLEHGVMIGTERLSPQCRARDGVQVLFDPDDMSRIGSPPAPDWEGNGFDGWSPEIPLRVWRPIIEGEECLCWDSAGEHACSWPGETSGVVDGVRCPSGVAGLAIPLIEVDGYHALRLPDPSLDFDVNTFMINMLGHFFYTRGTEIRWDLCMATNSCTVEEHGFYTPPVRAAEDR